jgi:hypothetical protein
MKPELTADEIECIFGSIKEDIEADRGIEMTDTEYFDALKEALKEYFEAKAKTGVAKSKKNVKLSDMEKFDIVVALNGMRDKIPDLVYHNILFATIIQGDRKPFEDAKKKLEKKKRG